MTVRFSQQLYQTFRLLFAAFTVSLPSLATAGDDHHTSGAASLTSCHFELAGTEELCGWVDVGTHDSETVPTPAAQPSQPESDTTVAAIASAACASAGVSVQQIVEPFAMVGPYLDQSLQSVERFGRWWKDAVTRTRDELEAKAELQDKIDALAALEPIDIERLGPSVLVDDLAPVVDGGELTIEVIATDPLVGSSPMIFTIEDTYLSYDMSQRDMKLWSVLPTPSRPFCVRSHADASPLWRDFDELVLHSERNRLASSPEPVAVCGSADCHLHELLWRMETWVAADSALWTVIEPRNVGRGVAGLLASSHRLAAGAAQLLASYWPEAEETYQQLSPAGEALLARAGAIESSQPPCESVTDTQIAEVPTSRHVQ
jgi:hypothetical protein